LKRCNISHPPYLPPSLPPGLDDRHKAARLSAAPALAACLLERKEEEEKDEEVFDLSFGQVR